MNDIALLDASSLAPRRRASDALYNYDFALKNCQHIRVYGVTLPQSLQKLVSYYASNEVLVEYIAEGGADKLRSSQDYITLYSMLLKHPALSKLEVKKTVLPEDRIVLLNREIRSNVISISTEASETKKVFSEIIRQARLAGASDLHFEARRDHYQSVVRIRVHGEMVPEPLLRMPYDDMTGLLKASYQNSEMLDAGSNSASELTPINNADCTMTLNEPDLKCALRWQTISLGKDDEYDVVIRISDSSGASEAMPLASIGFAQDQRNTITMLVKKPSGIVILSGVTGSGKTTTLESMVSMAAKSRTKKIWTVEDPVERKVRGVSSIQLQRLNKEGFGSKIPLLMRSDPDLAVFGEIRDGATAEASFDLVRTGHLVFSTLHANNAMGIFGRLMSKKFGIDAATLAESGIVAAFVYQRLLPLLCPHCKVPYVGNERLLSDLDSDELFSESRYNLSPEKVSFRNADGCNQCRHGHVGMTICAEMVIPNDQILSHVFSGNITAAKNQWRMTRRANFRSYDTTGKTAIEVGLAKVNDGLIDPVKLQDELGSLYMESIVAF